MRVLQPPRAVRTLSAIGAAVALAVTGLALAPSAAHADDVVTIPDATLKAAVDAAVGGGRTATQDVTEADAAKVTTLTISSAITDLTGAQALTNLTSFSDTKTGNGYSDLAPLTGLTKLKTLALANGQITSIAPLAGLTALTSLQLQGNQIADVSPLAGLGSLATVSLATNPIRDLSGFPVSPQMKILLLNGDDIKDPSPLASKLSGAAATLTQLNLSGNRITDASSLAALGTNGALLGSQTGTANGLNLSANRIADFSAFSGWSKPPTVGSPTHTSGQSVYAGPYVQGGVAVALKMDTAAVPAISAGGSYDPTTGELTLTDPTAASVTVSPNWTVLFSNPPIDPGDDNGPQIAGTPQVGQTLTVSDPGVTLDATGCTTFSYQWLRDGEEFAGAPHFSDDLTDQWGLQAVAPAGSMGAPGMPMRIADSGRYTVSVTDLSHQLSVLATCTAGAGVGVSSTSRPAAVVTAEQPGLPLAQATEGITTYRSSGGAVTTTPETRSGVVSDPTNPTIPIYLAQLDDTSKPVDPTQIQLRLDSITGVSSGADLTAVTTADVQVTGAGANRTITVTPEKPTNGSISLNFTVTGTTGVTSAFSVGYAASTATTPTSRVLLGSADASTAINVGDGYLMVGDDEGSGQTSVRLYDSADSGREVAQFNAGAPNALSGEWDLEASARKGDEIWWFGSEGNDKDGKIQASRQQIFETTLSGTGANATITPNGVVYQNLRNDLVAWDHANGDRLGIAAGSAKGNRAEVLNGFDLEGAEFSPDGSELYLGMRAPVSPAQMGGKAVIIPVTNVGDLTSGAATKAQFDDPILLDLGGQSIREIRKNASGEYLIIGASPGVAAKAPTQETLWAWNGEPDTAPQRLTTQLPLDVEPNYSDNAGAWEGIFGMPDHLTPGATVGLIMDQGYDGLYGAGQDNKDTIAGFTAKSRTDLVTLAGPMGTVADLSTPAVFPAQAANTIGTAQKVTVTNRGSNVLHVGDVATTDTDGVSADDFLISGNTCSGTALQPTESCTVRVRFAPSQANATSTADLVVESNVAGGSDIVQLTGRSANLPAGPQGPAGARGPIGPQGKSGLTGSRGPAGTIGFSAAKHRVSARPDSRVRLRFLVENRTADSIFAKVKAKVPAVLRSVKGKSLKVARLAAGKNGKVSFVLKVSPNAKPGKHKVRVTFMVDGQQVTRTVVVRVHR